MILSVTPFLLSPPRSWYYRSVITFACGASCVLGIIVTISLINVKVGRRRGIVM